VEWLIEHSESGLSVDARFLQRSWELEDAVLAALRRYRAAQRVQPECHVLPRITTIIVNKDMVTAVLPSEGAWACSS
jgi:hypothetical protein